MFLSNTDEFINAKRNHFCRMPTNWKTSSLSIFVDEGKLNIIKQSYLKIRFRFLFTKVIETMDDTIPNKSRSTPGIPPPPPPGGVVVV